MYDTSTWFTGGQVTDTATAESLKYIGSSSWDERSFDLTNAHGDTELEVYLIPISDTDRDITAPGSLADVLFDEDEITRAMKIPDAGHYVLTVNSDGVPTGYRYDDYREARDAFEYVEEQA